jgi:hypothetical protein
MIFMQAKYRSAAIVFFAFAILSGACNKGEFEVTDSIAPVIHISSPSNNQVFAPGTFIPIGGTVVDNNYIAEIHVHVSDNTTGTLLMDVHRYPAGVHYTLNESFVASPGVQYKIQVIARDRGVNEAVSTVYASCN